MHAMMAKSVLVTVTLVCLGGAGCSAQTFSYSDLEGPGSAGRPPPTDLPSSALDGFNRQHIRWVGERAGTSVWLSTGVEARPVCLLSYTDAQEWVTGCGGQGLTVGSPPGPTFKVVADGVDAPPSATAVSSNVYVLSP